MNIFFIKGLTIRDLEDLLVDIKVYTDLEPNKNTQYWNDMILVTQDELKKLQKMDKNSKGTFFRLIFNETCS